MRRRWFNSGNVWIVAGAAMFGWIAHSPLEGALALIGSLCIARGLLRVLEVR